MHKTGTTAIQEGLKNLKNGKTCYVPFDEQNHSIPMTTLFIDDPSSYYIWRARGMTAGQVDVKKATYLKVLEDAIADRKTDRLIISGEDISNMASSGKQRMLDFFKDRGVSVKVICFLRRPEEYVTSAVQQRIQGGRRSLPLINPGYRLRLEHFLDQLGRENMDVRDFGDVMTEYGSAVKGFAAICGLAELQEHRANTSMSESATKLIYRFNKMPIPTAGTVERRQARSKFVTAIKKAFPKSDSDKLDSTTLRSLLHPNTRAQVAYLKNTFGIDYSDIDYVGDPEICEKYLGNTAEIDTEALRKAVEEHGVVTAPGDKKPMMLTELYFRMFYT